MKYFLDTNILLIYLRDERTKNHIEEKFSPFSETNIPIISVVTLGEIESIALRNNWGDKRLNAVQKFFNKCVNFFRRLSRDFEKTVESSVAFMQTAFIDIILSRLA